MTTPRSSMAPPYLPEEATIAWTSLAAPTTGSGSAFDPAQASELPAPVARWLRHALEPGAPVRFGVEVAMHGSIRIGRWMPFTAEQIVAPAGYVWAAEAGRFPIRIRGFDRYSDATGQMAWRLFGRIPVMTATGSDIDRSAAGRLASELLGLTPGGALHPSVTWRKIDDHRAVATIAIDGADHEVTVTIDDQGALRTLTLPRWAKPDKGPFQLHTFGVVCHGELTTDGCTLPRTIEAGWWPDSPRWAQGEFFRATIDRARPF